MDGRAMSLQATLNQLRLDEISVYSNGNKVKVTNAYFAPGRLVVDIEDV